MASPSPPSQQCSGGGEREGLRCPRHWALWLVLRGLASFERGKEEEEEEEDLSPAAAIQRAKARRRPHSSGPEQQQLASKSSAAGAKALGMRKAVANADSPCYSQRCCR